MDIFVPLFCFVSLVGLVGVLTFKIVKISKELLEKDKKLPPA